MVRAARGPRVNGIALTAVRRLRGLSQVELGVHSGVHHTHISRLERGERLYPAMRVTRALAEALDIPVEALLAVEVNEVVIDDHGRDQRQWPNGEAQRPALSPVRGGGLT